MEVKAKANLVDEKTGNSEEKHVKVNYEFGDDLKAMVSLFTDKIVHAHARANMIVALQSYLRGLVKQGKSDKEIADAVAEWKPSMREPGKAAVDRIAESVEKLSKEERQALMEQLKADLGKA